MRIKIIKNRSDIGAGTRGADLGIDAMEIAAINNDNDFFQNHDFVDVKTHNESIYNKVNTTSAKRIKFVFEQCQRVSRAVENVLRDNDFPLVLSGDHSSALGVISGVKASDPSKRLGVIWIDAHADIHSPYTSPSGNVHGMPLAAALHLDNKEMKAKGLKKEALQYWNNLKSLGNSGPKLLAEDLIYFGVRDLEDPEKHIINTNKIKNYSVSEIRFRGLNRCLEESFARLSNCDFIYLTFDVDSLDCDFVSYGTGTPVPLGFTPNEVKSIITGFLRTKKIACIEVAEVNPLLDNQGNKMAETAFDIIDSCLASINHEEKPVNIGR